MICGFSELKSMFNLSETKHLRVHVFKLKIEHLKNAVRQNFLINRVFNEWKSLRAKFVESPCLTQELLDYSRDYVITLFAFII